MTQRSLSGARRTWLADRAIRTARGSGILMLILSSVGAVFLSGMIPQVPEQTLLAGLVSDRLLAWVVAWTCATAHVVDNIFQWLMRQCEERMIVLRDTGFHAAEGDLPNRKWRSVCTIDGNCVGSPCCWR